MNQLSQIKLSIIIATFNREKRLKKSLPLLLSEDSDQYEFIIIDNNSSDKTQQLVSSFSKKDNRIRYFKNHSNIGANRNYYRGYLEAKSNWICFMTDDDYVQPGFLSELIKIIDKNQDCGLIINSNNNGGDNNLTKSRRVKSGIEALKLSFKLTGVLVGLTINKKLIKQEYWTLDNSIYPQICLALNLSLENDIYIHIPKNKITIGKEDTIDFIVSNRPKDFGIFERLKILIQISKEIKLSSRIDFINSLTITLFYWSINVSKEIFIKNKQKGIYFLKNLMKNSFVKSSMSFHGILIIQYILNRNINLKFKIKIGVIILKSILLSVFNKNLYQSFFYIASNYKSLKMKKYMN